MDAVITYVNGMEPKWRYLYDSYNGMNMLPHRFMDYGTLRFVLRGISEHMKFIDRVFLVVSSIEQVPDYVNDNVIIITHDMFIPEEYLPTFNSHTIEMFLWNIPDLSEEFIYFNDDMIPINKMEREEFFKNGLPCLSFLTDEIKSNNFNVNIIFNNNRAYNAIDNTDKKLIDTLRTTRTITPFLKNIYKNNFLLLEQKGLLNNITRLRQNRQLSQYYFSCCCYYNDAYVEGDNMVYFTTTKQFSDDFLTTLKENIIKYQILNINDQKNFLDKTYKETIEIINNTLSEILPNKGCYEK